MHRGAFTPGADLSLKEAEMSKIIPLTRGKETIVDDEDFEWLSQWKWIYLNSGDGYAVRYSGGKSILMHREIMKADDGTEVDHRFGNTLINQKYNLRICTHKDNMHNRKISKDNTSGFKGVSLRQSSRWYAHIRVNGKTRHLGSYLNKINAAHAYDEAAKKYFGEFARTNFG
jgi:hypothetical protein